MPSQLTFRWSAPASFAASDFITAPANAQAVSFLQHWPDGAARTALLSGPKASGKSHLASGWAARHRAIFIDGGELGHTDSTSLWKNARYAVLEDIHRIGDEAALFHLLRHAESHALALLLTSRLAAPHLAFTLADLRSRLLALPSAIIHTPDETLLRAYLVKGFADRQMRLGKPVIDYLLRHMERDFETAEKVITSLEEHAAAEKKAITISLIKSWLYNNDSN